VGGPLADLRGALAALRLTEAMAAGGGRPDGGGAIDDATVRAAQELRWPHGPCRALLRPSHAGLRGQWLDAWAPRQVRRAGPERRPAGGCACC
jgi:hypothetical protein